ncbi:collagen alpha-1(I) chain-like [Dermochelys coriacea]|uniref:collagen alpha-1(I) chain-like n=1 Tax=Dermochelys coriacea TaxID=27794 RepID=UPI0018E6EC6B|nr:collagen alpha-1(I) chain-like [Dermochelys coriacea]
MREREQSGFRKQGAEGRALSPFHLKGGCGPASLLPARSARDRWLGRGGRGLAALAINIHESAAPGLALPGPESEKLCKGRCGGRDPGGSAAARGDYSACGRTCCCGLGEARAAAGAAGTPSPGGSGRLLGAAGSPQPSWLGTAGTEGESCGARPGARRPLERRMQPPSRQEMRQRLRSLPRAD